MVELRRASVRLDGGAFAVRELDLAVRAGETLVLLGRSGCGKTTTLKLINALRLPSSGEVLVEGRSTRDWEPYRLRRRAGWVIQEVGLFPHYDVAGNVGLVPRLEGWEPARVAARVDQLLALVGLEPELFRRRLPRELSGGQRQRVGLARALAAEPRLLLMDEPFGSLDPLTREELVAEFAALARRLGTTVVLVTHDVREAVKLADRIALLEAGGLAFLGTVAEFRSAPAGAARAFAAVLDS